MLSAIAAGALLVSSLGAPAPSPGSPVTSRTAVPPPAEDMVIGVVAANGSGCPKNTAEVTVSPDNKAFTVSYSAFVAQVGPEARATDFRKNCQLALDVRVPSGYTYAIAGADYRGYASLQEGATASETAHYYFQGEQHTTKIRHDFEGWMEDDWLRTDKVEITSESFLPCGEDRHLNVNTELRVNAGTSEKAVTNFIAMDSSDGDLATEYHVSWLKC